MSTLARPLVTWGDFLRLPERPEGAQRYELQDGEVVVVPPARPLHIKIQKRIERLLEGLAGERGVVTIEFPYRPVVNLQYWFADVAYVPRPDWDALPPDEYPVYSPSLIVEVLSPSNTPARVSRQRIVVMSAGTQEFWVVDADKRTVLVTDLKGTKSYASGDAIPLAILGDGSIAVGEIFAS
ncbi:MAG: Uma2 family endonuclease [Acidobacteriia bacterium]|nr:Uma2 family endonuclease [Terriglobia bacterium]